MDLAFQVPMQYCCLQHWTLLPLPVTATTGFFFLLWLCLFILSGVISPLISSSILGTYWPGVFIFQCLIFLAFHTVHRFSRQECWSGAVSFSSGPRFVGTLHHDPSILSGPTPWLIASLTRLWSMWSDWLVFCDCGFHSSALWWRRIRGLWKLPDGRDWLWGKLGLVLMGPSQ